MRASIKTAGCLVVAIFLLIGIVGDSHAQSNGWAFEWQTNDGKFPLRFTNTLPTDTFAWMTGAMAPLTTNLVVTNIFVTQTNYGPWGPGGPPATPPKKPWYKRFWDWLKGLL